MLMLVNYLTRLYFATLGLISKRIILVVGRGQLHCRKKELELLHINRASGCDH